MTFGLDRHVSESRRIAYALGDGTASDRARVAAHLMACPACRAEVAAVADLATRARDIPLEAAPAGALERILAGERLDPRESNAARPRRTGWGYAAAAAIAAGLLVVLPPLVNRTSPARGSEGDRDLLAVIGSPVAFAQTPAGPLSDVDPERARNLRGGAWIYQRVSPSGGTPLLIEESISIPGGGEPVIFAHSRPGGRVWADTLSVDPRTLTPLRFVLRRSEAIWLETRIDSERVTHSFPSRVGKGPIVRHVEDAPLPPVLAGKPFLITTDRGLPLYIRALPLRRGAEFRIGALWTESSAPAFGVTTGAVVLRVVGEEVVRVPAGTFHAWRLIVDWPGDLRRELWVAKGSQVLLRDRLSGPGRQPYEIALEAGTVD